LEDIAKEKACLLMNALLRINKNNQKKDNTRDLGLEALLFQYGRYLLISSSRGNTLPANLQGVWNALPKPAWNSDITPTSTYR
jgi:alpha-L-fucosidase 2